ncbi:hypothetical protein CEXT_396901 [Caerostris extrusa]|uniref:Uncharacterized protein n=1 Tax=Caerostris extrusa TaxID=172846 RepID=A0AAV4QAW3_CAEEX|nr:hypothetical protein CEXT_396901 [Caerostris extrusa]
MPLPDLATSSYLSPDESIRENDPRRKESSFFSHAPTSGVIMQMPTGTSGGREIRGKKNRLLSEKLYPAPAVRGGEFFGVGFVYLSSTGSHFRRKGPV